MQVGDYPQGDGFFIGATDKKNNADYYDFEFLGDTLPTVRNYRHFAIEKAMQTATGDNWKKFDWNGVNDIPEVRITAQVKKDYVQEEKEFYGHKFLTEDAMDKHHYQSFQEMIYHFSPFMKLMQERKDLGEVSEGSDNEDEHLVKWHLYPVSRISTLRGKSEIKIYVDGVLIEATDAVNINMDDIATVEFLNGGQSLARHPFCIEGCLELTTKRYKPQLVQSKGVMYIPEIGIANYGIYPQTTFMSPQQEGQYLMIIDSLTDDYHVQTFARMVTVK